MSNQPQSIQLNLAKFSHAITTTDPPGPMAWTHVNSNGDLSCALDRFGEGTSAPSRLILRVIRNNSVLEQLDLAYYVRNNHSSTSQNASLQKSAFAVVVKSPCLAVKYPQGGLRVRRLQIKFCHESDYYKALAILSEIKCPLTEGSTAMQKAQRAPSSSSWTSAPMSATAAKDMGTAINSENTTPMPMYPMSGCLPYGMTTPNPPSPSSASTYNMAPSMRSKSPGLQALNGSSSFINPRPMPPFQSSQKQHTTSQNPNVRSATASVYYDESQLNQLLPPKRQLPFAKSSQKRIRTDTSSQPEASQAMSQPTVADHCIDPPSNQLHGLAASQNKLELFDSQRSDSQSQSLILTQPYPEAANTSCVSAALQNTQPCPFTVIADEQQQAVSTSPTFTVPIGVNAIGGRQSQRTTETLEDQLALYLSSPTPERVAFLENWMCELIEDDKFMRLCQDVEATWRRFAFGIKK